MPPSTEPRDHSCSLQQAFSSEPVKRSVKFDQNIEFSDKGVGKLAPQEERIQARNLRHRLRREWSSSSDLDASQDPIGASSSSPPQPPCRKRSTVAKSKDTTAPMCPQRQRSIGLTKDDIPLLHRTS